MKKTTFIYGLLDPETKEVRYIGKSNRPQRRLIRHLREERNNHKCNWLKSLNGSSPELIIIDEVINSEWEFWESFYIELFRSWGFNLTNSTEGGLGTRGFTGMVHSEETKNLLRKQSTGRRHPNQYQCGFDNPRCKVTEEDIIEMYRLKYKENLPYKKIGNQFNMHRKSVAQILKGLRFPEIFETMQKQLNI